MVNHMITEALKRRGAMFVLSSPSGAGKTSVAREVLCRDSNLSLSVSVTTRLPRDGEKDGQDYFFVTESEYLEKLGQGMFLEHAEVFGNFYGTLKSEVDSKLCYGEDILFDIDWQGTQQLRETARDDLVTIFILPPSYGELESRLINRGKDTKTVVLQRMQKAADEMSHWPEYDYVVINKELETAIHNVMCIVNAERLRRSRYIGLGDLVSAKKLL
jgi:guanylate kinase